MLLFSKSAESCDCLIDRASCTRLFCITMCVECNGGGTGYLINDTDDPLRLQWKPTSLRSNKMAEEKYGGSIPLGHATEWIVILFSRTRDDLVVSWLALNSRPHESSPRFIFKSKVKTGGKRVSFTFFKVRNNDRKIWG